MKYLTKEWYDLCQKTYLHFGKRVHGKANNYDEALYDRLYKRKEKEFVNDRHQSYDYDPRFMLDNDGMKMVPLEKWINGEDISEADTLVYKMPPEERARMEQKIAEYDVRPPFDREESKRQFSELQGYLIEQAREQLSPEIQSEIADLRVYALGYCTREVKRQLKLYSEQNRKEMERISEACRAAYQAEDIPQRIGSVFGFHDCRVTELIAGPDIVIRLNTSGGFTEYNQITFVASEVVIMEEGIVGSHWLYHELYRHGEGYEVHALLSGRQGSVEFVLRCRDIRVEITT